MNEKYIPLYRKYRPQTIEEIVGQEHIKKALINTIQTNRIAHAYLFTGPRGTGKTSTARIFAKSLNCENGPTVKPCGKCSNCVDIQNSVPMDVIEIDAASNRKVEDAQNILERVMYAPVKSKYKIYIIDEVHMLSNTAFNALLKTLEEPPENVVFILATTEVHKVLDTIKSRCQRFDFRRITTADIVKHLRYISDSEGINITDDALLTIAKNSAGGMRDSIALLDQLSILNGEQAISTEDINNLLGRLSFDILEKLADSIITSKQNVALELLEHIYNSGNEPSLILSNLLEYFKNMLIAKTCTPEITTELTQLTEAQIKSISAQALTLETHQITFLIDKIAEYVKRIKLTANPRLWMEVGIIDLANLSENTKLNDFRNRLCKLETGITTPASNVYFQKMSPKDVSKNLRNMMGNNAPQAQKTEEVNQTVVNPPQNNESENKVVTNTQEQTAKATSEDFTPMPRAKTAEPDKLAVLWTEILSNIPSVPTVTLLKQWANPVKITPAETIISIKTELFLNRINSGNKKELIIAAVDKLFEQEYSNVVIRLPMEDDEETVIPPNLAQKAPEKPAPNIPPQDEISEEEIQEAAEQNADSPVKTQNSKYNEHSDQVNMVVDLFDGKVIE